MRRCVKPREPNRASVCAHGLHLCHQRFRGDEAVGVLDEHRDFVPVERDIESQIKNLRDRRARVLLEKNYTL